MALKTGNRSLTADFAAMLRVAHVIMDAEPKLLNDRFALKLCGFESTDEFRRAMTEIECGLVAKFPDIAIEKLMADARSGIVVRSKIAEQRLSDAIDRGVSQYVILGAGLDSSAYRLPGIADKMHIFEVDFPATQDWKRARLAEIEPNLADLVTFVPIDFERDSLFEVLIANGYDPEKPTFFSWLGVVWYLSDDAIFGTLKNIASLQADCEIAFEYPLAAKFVHAADRPLMALLNQAGAARGEPMRPGFDPDDFKRRVEALGFDLVVDLSPEAIHDLYFQDRSDNLRMPGIGHFMSARRTFTR